MVERERFAVTTGWSNELGRRRAAGYTRLINSDFGVGAIRDGVVFKTVRDVDVTVDILEPRGEGPHPVLVYLHGGGFCNFRSRDYRVVALRFAEAGFLVFNVDYRLAPEAPFPAGYEDCVDAVRWVGTNAHKYHGDARRLGIAGDSAGANLAAAVAVGAVNDATLPSVSATVLIYGIYDSTSMLEDDITREAWVRMLSRYVGESTDAYHQDPRINPFVEAKLLPPSYITVGSNDWLCLRQSEVLATALDTLGTPYQYVVNKGWDHGFIVLESVYPEVGEEFDRISTFLYGYLGSTSSVM